MLAVCLCVTYVYNMCGYVVFRLYVTKTDKCNSSVQRNPHLTSLTSSPCCELARARHEELQRSHVTQHTLTSVIRPAAIQFSADQCIQHMECPGQSERERITQSSAGWACRQLSQPLADSCCTADKPLTIDQIPRLMNGHSGEPSESHFTEVRRVELAHLALLGGEELTKEERLQRKRWIHLCCYVPHISREKMCTPHM